MATTSYSSTALLSFAQWLDNRLAGTGNGYFNVTTRLYYQADPSLPPGHVAYAAPFRSWVYDSGVNGAVVLNAISGTIGLAGTGQITRAQSGMVVDYTNGRVILNSAVGTAAIISGTYAVKEMNVYLANQSAETMVFANKYTLNSRFNRQTTPPPPNSMVTPCVIVSDDYSENENWAFGGKYNTVHEMGVYVMAESIGQLEGVLSVLADTQDVNFPPLSTTTWPLNASGDVKGGAASGYNYNALMRTYGGASNLCRITDVQVTKIGDGTPMDQSIWLGGATFRVERQRFAH